MNKNQIFKILIITAFTVVAAWFVVSTFFLGRHGVDNVIEHSGIEVIDHDSMVNDDFDVVASGKVARKIEEAQSAFTEKHLAFLRKLDSLESYKDKASWVGFYLEDADHISEKKFIDHLLLKRLEYLEKIPNLEEGLYEENVRLLMDSPRTEPIVRDRLIYIVLQKLAFEKDIAEFVNFVDSTKELRSYKAKVAEKMGIDEEEIVKIDDEYQLMKATALFMDEVSRGSSPSSLTMIAAATAMFTQMYELTTSGYFEAISEEETDWIGEKAKENYVRSIFLYKELTDSEYDNDVLGLDMLFGMNYLALVSYQLKETGLVEELEIETDVLFDSSEFIINEFGLPYKEPTLYLHALIIAKEKKENYQERVVQYLERLYTQEHWKNGGFSEESLMYRIVSSKNNNRKDYFSEQSDVFLLASIDGEFKKWLMQNGWVEADFN